MSFWKRRKEENKAVEVIGSSGWKFDASGEKQRVETNQVQDKKMAPPLVLGGSAAPVISSSDLCSVETLERRFGKIRSALGEGTVIHGKLSFDVPVRIDGKLSGEVYSSQTLIVGPRGSIEASIDTCVLIVLGRVHGDVRAKERIEIMEGASLTGSVHAPVFVIKEGGSFDGTITMPVVPTTTTEQVTAGQVTAKEVGTQSQVASKDTPTKNSNANFPTTAQTSAV